MRRVYATIDTRLYGRVLRCPTITGPAVEGGPALTLGHAEEIHTNVRGRVAPAAAPTSAKTSRSVWQRFCFCVAHFFVGAPREFLFPVHFPCTAKCMHACKFRLRRNAATTCNCDACERGPQPREQGSDRADVCTTGEAAHYKPRHRRCIARHLS